MTTSVYGLLTEWADRIRTLPEMGWHSEFPGLFDWAIEGLTATFHIDSLGKLYLEPTKDEEGNFTGKQTLVSVPSPDTLPIINALHALGWKRTDRVFSGGPGWLLEAYLRTDDGSAVLRVSGYHFDRDEWEKANTAIPYFAPPPPELSRKKSFLPAYREWERMCREDAW